MSDEKKPTFFIDLFNSGRALEDAWESGFVWGYTVATLIWASICVFAYLWFFHWHLKDYCP
jgi:hypothetical protein